MIQYMPLTYIPEPLVDSLTAMLGPLTVWQPLEDLLPAHMRSAAEKGVLRLRYPADVDPELLARTANAFSAWADLHHGRSGDLSGFFGSERNMAAWWQESSHCLRTQIRPSGRPEPAAVETPLFQAALFLILAHRYDQQQDDLNLELGTAADFTQKLGELLGESGAQRPAWKTDRPAADPAAHDPAAYMTERRIQSWARLAAAEDAASAGVFITGSQAVWQSLLERLPEAVPVLQCRLDPGQGATSPPEALAALLSDLLQAQHPQSVSADRIAGNHGQRPGWALSLNVLAGRPPNEVLRRLMAASRGSRTPAPSSATSSNTVIGWLRPLA